MCDLMCWAISNSVWHRTTVTQRNKRETHSGVVDKRATVLLLWCGAIVGQINLPVHSPQLHVQSTAWLWLRWTSGSPERRVRLAGTNHQQLGHQPARTLS